MRYFWQYTYLVLNTPIFLRSKFNPQDPFAHDIWYISAAIGSNCQIQKLSRKKSQVLNLQWECLEFMDCYFGEVPKRCQKICNLSASLTWAACYRMGPSVDSVLSCLKKAVSLWFMVDITNWFMGGCNGLFKNQLTTGRPHPVQVIPNSLSSSVGLAPLDPFRYVWTSAKFDGDGNVILVGGFNHLEKY